MQGSFSVQSSTTNFDKELTMRKNEAYVSSNALMTQLASTSSSPNASLSAGRPANSAFRLYESMRFATQKMEKRKHRRAFDMRTRGASRSDGSSVSTAAGGEAAASTVHWDDVSGVKSEVFPGMVAGGQMERAEASLISC